jgi:acetylglutamate kinase
MNAPLVLKIGGRALESDGAPRELATEIALTPGPLVLVHGGGAEVSAWCQRLGIAPRFHDGLRVTDPPTLEVAAAVLAGLANKRLVAVLRAGGIDAVGLSAADGGIVEVRPHPDAATLGEVAAVESVHPTLLATLLGQGRVPVLASIAAWRGRLMNLNADDLAAAVAAALGARALVLLSDTPGLMLGGGRVAHLPAASLDGAMAHPDVKGGMLAKLHAARAAIAGGITRVHIAAWEGPGTLRALLAGAGPGTTIEAHANAEVTHG